MRWTHGKLQRGVSLEESVTVNVQCHGEALRVAYVTIIYYGNNNQDRFNRAHIRRGFIRLGQA